MRKTQPFLFLLALVSLTGCPGNNTQRDTGTIPPNDTGVPPVDMGTGGMDSGTDAGSIAATDVPIASVVNGAASDHPADGSTIHVTGSLVALTPRLFLSQSSTSMRCLFAIWVGTAAGGDYSGVEVTETFLPSGTNSCFDEPAHMIPDSVMIGDSITTVTGRFINFCPSGSSCPPNTAQELDVTSGAFTVGTHSGDPTATTATIAEVAGMGLTLGTRSMALQGAVVRIAGTVIVELPSAANHNVMMVAATGTTTPVMPIEVSKYPGVTCQRSELMTRTVGATVGDVTGVLTYSFGQWVLQPRQSADMPGVPCTMDAGVPNG